eukprot:sb/3467359/
MPPLEEVKNTLKGVPFSKIQEQRLKSLEKESVPILQLREKLRPQLQGLVNKQEDTFVYSLNNPHKLDTQQTPTLGNEVTPCQRARRSPECEVSSIPTLTPNLRTPCISAISNILHISGESFSTASSNRRRPRTLFCRLSSNHKTLHYGYDIPIEGNTCPSIDELPEKLNVDIEDVVLWKDQKRQRERGLDSPLGFSIEHSHSTTGPENATKPLYFICQTNEVFQYWTDGLNVLQKKDASNAIAKEHLSMLLEMEIKIRQLDILDIEGLQMPGQAPPVPPMPDNFNFHNHYNFPPSPAVK